MNNFFKKSIFGLFSLVILFTGFGVKAGEFIDVEYPIGTNINGDKIFKAENIYPGWNSSKIIRVRNKDIENNSNVYFNFDTKGDKKLAGKLKLYVIRVKDNSYRIGGSGDRWTLKNADDEDLYVDRLDPEESTQYRIKIEFDKKAGNEYQNLTTKFNIDFNVEAQSAEEGIAEEENENQILADQGREDFTGEPANDEQENGEARALGAEESKEVKGEENKCQSWPRWFWILITTAFAVTFLALAKIMKVGVLKKYFIGQLASVGALLIMWYFLDECRYYKWFPIAIMSIGVINNLMRRFVRSKLS